MWYDIMRLKFTLFVGRACYNFFVTVARSIIVMCMCVCLLCVCVHIHTHKHSNQSTLSWPSGVHNRDVPLYYA